MPVIDCYQIVLHHLLIQCSMIYQLFHLDPVVLRTETVISTDAITYFTDQMDCRVEARVNARWYV